jgi:NCAIR mutase (PurE)-related protein
VPKKTRANRIFIDPYDDLGYAKIDLHREKRKGFPEVVFAQGKTTKQILDITARIYHFHKRVLLTRVNPALARALKRAKANTAKAPVFFPLAKLFLNRGWSRF